MRGVAGPRSGWTVVPRVARREREAMLDYCVATPAHWRVIDPGATTALGHPAGYVVHPENSVAHRMLHDHDPAARRAGFTRHQLWVTPRVADERYAAGMYMNQGPGGEGLPAWTAANRAIADTDIVLRYTAAFHQVPRSEDYPIMPSAWHEVSLVPFNFLPRNPALDVRVGGGRRRVGGRSVVTRSASGRPRLW
jgi:primary-amine oxidase